MERRLDPKTTGCFNRLILCSITNLMIFVSVPFSAKMSWILANSQSTMDQTGNSTYLAGLRNERFPICVQAYERDFSKNTGDKSTTPTFYEDI